MKYLRYPLIVLVITFMLLSGGCSDIDWKAGLKHAAAFALEELTKVSIDMHGRYKMDAIDWVMEQLEDLDWAQPVLSSLDVRTLVEMAYDQLWKYWYSMLRDSGYDTDAMMARENKIHYLAGKECPGGLHDKLILMME